MKVIDLYNKIANGKIKDKTIFRISWGHIYRDFYYDGNEENQLQCLKNCSDDYPLYDDIKLNDEVEIIEDTPKEDKKIEKLDVVLLGQCDNWLQPTIDTDEKIRAELNPYIIDVIRENTLVMQRKINEIIDKVNGR